MNTATNATESSRGSDLLTIDKIQAALALLPPPISPKIYAVNSKTWDALQQHTSPQAHLGLPSSYTGMPIHHKPGQRVNCWAFSDPKLARRYLDDEITEEDLVKIIAGLITPEQAPATNFTLL